MHIFPASSARCCSCQGSRDTFGTPSELKPILGSLSPLPTLHTVHGGDHSFKIAGRDAKQKQAAVYEEIQNTIVDGLDAASSVLNDEGAAMSHVEGSPRILRRNVAHVASGNQIERGWRC